MTAPKSERIIELEQQIHNLSELAALNIIKITVIGEVACYVRQGLPIAGQRDKVNEALLRCLDISEADIWHQFTKHPLKRVVAEFIKWAMDGSLSPEELQTKSPISELLAPRNIAHKHKQKEKSGTGKE